MTDFSLSKKGYRSFKSRFQHWDGTQPIRPTTREGYRKYAGQRISEVKEITQNQNGITIHAIIEPMRYLEKIEHFDVWGFPGATEALDGYFGEQGDKWKKCEAMTQFRILFHRRSDAGWEDNLKSLGIRYPLTIDQYAIK